jgi:hypothetical protein
LLGRGCTPCKPRHLFSIFCGGSAPTHTPYIKYFAVFYKNLYRGFRGRLASPFYRIL